MPIYEYECQACGHQLEIMHKIDANPEQSCPECASADLKRLISAPQFKLKGNGWYETDFKNSGAKPEEKKSTSSDAKAQNSSSTSDGKNGD